MVDEIRKYVSDTVLIITFIAGVWVYLSSVINTIQRAVPVRWRRYIEAKYPRLAHAARATRKNGTDIVAGLLEIRGFLLGTPFLQTAKEEKPSSRFPMMVLLAMAFMVVPMGCSGRQRTRPEIALITIHSAAHGMVIADNLVATACGVASPAPACDGFVRSYAITRASLRMLETAADQWRESGTVPNECLFGVLAQHAKSDIEVTIGFVEELGVQVPDEITNSLTSIADAAVAHIPACSANAADAATNGDAHE